MIYEIVMHTSNLNSHFRFPESIPSNIFSLLNESHFEEFHLVEVEGKRKGRGEN
jgi:hypothetical protein